MYKLCFVGLGNPGSKYQNTRHNIGKDFLKKISIEYSLKFSKKIKFEAEISESHSGNILWVIPDNYVNQSGRTVSKILKSTNLTSENIIVIHDDLDLKVGDLRLKENGGHGGHNGLRDIIEKINSKDFYRLRVGIDHPGKKEDVTNWVLSKFTPNEKKSISNAFKEFSNIFELICLNKISEVQKILHTK